MIIAIDAMGGDEGFAPIVEGVKLFVDSTQDDQVILVGEKEVLDANSWILKDKRLQFIESKDSVDMNIIPSEALKTKTNSSISVGLNLHKKGKADAFFSVGNTGVVMAFALVNLGRIKHILRPALACFFPTMSKPTLIIDSGANVDCKPPLLRQFGQMGSVYYSKLYDVKTPKVALLSIGEEPSKGNEQTLQAYKLFEKSDLNFIGNIEGGDIFKGKADVVVVDGFVGNIILKFAESMIEFLNSFFGKTVQIPSEMARKLTSEEYGAAPLIGVNGIVFIGHGKTSPLGVKNGLETVKKTYSQKIKEVLESKFRKEGQ
ncbi:phosphate acyltransferase PlsX [candidate division WOR-3 bacterium]|nr:phosphate acyltransferase PlsX [candidate division WOR-3 bacterium]